MLLIILYQIQRLQPGLYLKGMSVSIKYSDFNTDSLSYLAVGLYGLKLDQNVAWMCYFSLYIICPIFMMIRKVSPDLDERLRRKWNQNYE